MAHPADTPLLDRTVSGDPLAADIMRAVSDRAIVVLTAAGALAGLNDTARDLHGLPAGDAGEGWPAGRYGPPLAAGPETIGPVLRELTAGGPWRGVVECRHSSGRTVVTDLSVTRRHPEPGGFVLVYQPRPAGPPALGGAALSKLGHELRSPMNGIVGLARMLLRKLAAGPGDRDAQIHQLTLLLDSAGQMLRLIEQLLEVAGFHCDPRRPAAELIDGRDVVAEVVRTQQPAAGARGLRLVVEQPAGPVALRLPAAPLARVLSELVGNAIRYTGGADVRVRLTSAPGGVRIEVSDDGPGIPAGDRARIFEAFERGAADSAGGGAGLGLYLARQLAGGLGGELGLRDDPGPGVTFVLDLPGDG